MKPSERIAQIAQARYDRALSEWRRLNDEPPFTDLKPIDIGIDAIDVALYLDEADSRRADNPDLDATDGAHPAWWRGHDHAAASVAHLLCDIAKTGEHAGGEYGSAEVRAAAAAILELWSRIAQISQDRDRLLRGVEQLSESLTARVDRLELRKGSP